MRAHSMPFKRCPRTDISLRRVLQGCREGTRQNLNVRETDALLVNNVSGLRAKGGHASCLMILDTKPGFFNSHDITPESELGVSISRSA
jgi:hypothetical protein